MVFDAPEKDVLVLVTNRRWAVLPRARKAENGERISISLASAAAKRFISSGVLNAADYNAVCDKGHTMMNSGSGTVAMRTQDQVLPKLKFHVGSSLPIDRHESECANPAGKTFFL